MIWLCVCLIIYEPSKENVYNIALYWPGVDKTFYYDSNMHYYITLLTCECWLDRLISMCSVSNM